MGVVEGSGFKPTLYLATYIESLSLKSEMKLLPSTTPMLDQKQATGHRSHDPRLWSKPSACIGRHPPSGQHQPRQPHGRPRTRHVRAHFRPNPGPAPPQLLQALTLAVTAPLSPLPRMAARCGFGSSNRRSQHAKSALHLAPGQGSKHPALVVPLPSPESSMTRRQREQSKSGSSAGVGVLALSIVVAITRWCSDFHRGTVR
jgi:hypothetical protein